MKLAIWRKIKTLPNPTSTRKEDGETYTLRLVAGPVDLGKIEDHEMLIIKIGNDVDDRP